MERQRVHSIWRRLAILLIFSVHCFVCSAQLNTDRITAIGRNALYFEDYVLSIQYFNQVIKLKPYLAEPYLLRAIAKIQLSDYSGALRDCNTAIECNPFLPGAYYTRGFAYRQLGDLDKAEQDFTKALQTAAASGAALLGSPLTCDFTVISLSDLLTPLPAEPVFLMVARLLYSKGIREYLEAASVIKKKYPQARIMLVGGLDNNDEALNSLTKAISLGSKWAGDYMNRGIIYYQKHNYRAALADYDKAVTIDSRNAQTYYNRGMLRAELGDYNRALDDFNKAIDLEPNQTDMRYQRAMVLLQLRQWRQALEDLDELITTYPYFLPSYYLAAKAKTALGDSKSAYRYRKQAYDLEQRKDSIYASLQDSLNTPNTNVSIAQTTQVNKDRRKEFSARVAQNQNENSEAEEYTSETRGTVQKRYVDVVNQPNIVLSYYQSGKSYYHYLVEEYNRTRSLPSPLRFTTQEVALTAELINAHFDRISSLSAQLDVYEKQYTNSQTLIQLTPDKVASLYLARAMEFALVQDYSSAIDDCTKALKLSTFDYRLSTILTFCRANWRFKLLEYQRSTGTLTAESAMDFDIMLRDYDYVNKLQPDFAFAYYNKANMLCAQREYQDAINHYSKAIACDNDFAEAYFNRGLTYIFIDKVDEGIADLSKAGELGIYQAYNLITRFR